MYKVNKLKALAIKRMKSTEDDCEVMNREIDSEFHEGVREIIQVERGLLSVVIKGKVRGGKSTGGMSVALESYDYVNELLRRKGEGFNIKHIMRNQYEFIRFMNNSENVNCVILIDEWDKLEDTGENSTTEEALINSYNEVQAGRYVHKIWCSPMEEPDTQAEIILEIQSKDEKKKKTLAMVYYNLLWDGINRRLLIGHINIDTSKIVKNWLGEGIRDLILKPNKTKEEEEKIKEWQKKDWYVDYMIRKYEKMDLINKEGIMRTKTLLYAEVIKEVLDDMRPVISTGIVTEGDKNSMIMTLIEAKTRKYKIPTSLIGDSRLIKRVLGYLAPYEALRRLKREQVNVFSKKEDEGISDDIKKVMYKDKSDTINESIKIVVSVIDKQEEELKRMIEINKLYNRELYVEISKIKEVKK